MNIRTNKKTVTIRWLFSFFIQDLKDERHRATVRWTVATASDQAAAAARIDSLAARLTTPMIQNGRFVNRPYIITSNEVERLISHCIIADNINRFNVFCNSQSRSVRLL